MYTTIIIIYSTLYLYTDIGLAYLTRFLHQNWCDEIAIFLDLLKKYKHSTKCSNSINYKTYKNYLNNDKMNRWQIANNIIRLCIDPNSLFALNISYECRQDVLQKYKNIKCNKELKDEYFLEVEDEVCRLIMQNHWKKFVDDITQLSSNKYK